VFSAEGVEINGSLGQRPRIHDEEKQSAESAIHF
jgi:hypothetical protein